MGKRAIANLILCLIFGTALVIYYQVQQVKTKEVNPRYELASIQSDAQEKIIKHTGYTVSYNTEWRIPNWVAYELTAEEVAGTFPRENNFTDDPAISGEAESDVYTNSGYDRGHMAPAGDMKWSSTAMKESFYMTNICPQNHNLNGGDWKDLEEHVRATATKYGNIYICCGPIVEPSHRTIGKYSFEQIVVPNAFFKVLLRQKDSTWTAIGFKMPNKAGNNTLATYAMSVNDLEKLTEIDFFYNLPDSIEEIIESSYNLSEWDLKKPIPKKSNKASKQKEKVQTEPQPNNDIAQEKGIETVQPLEAVAVEDVVPASEQSTSTASTTSSSSQGTYNGHTVYTGPRGGRYYYNSKGKKVYIKK